MKRAALSTKVTLKFHQHCNGQWIMLLTGFSSSYKCTASNDRTEFLDATWIIRAFDLWNFFHSPQSVSDHEQATLTTWEDDSYHQNSLFLYK